jgi:metallo-beta-lactamase family protein
MELTFIGAAREVTGSCSYLAACGKNILIDYGMEQGKDMYENQEIPVEASDIDYVLLTHAHIDHSGLLPLLYARGFHGEIHATKATSNLCDIMLRDSAHIQMFEAEWRNRKAKRAGREEFIPLYTMDDAIGAIELFVPHPYDKSFELCPGITVLFTDAGHLLGSSSIQIHITENGVMKKIVFSGDLGNLNQPLLRDPVPIDTADYVVIESTYGDRLHDAPPDYAAALAKVLQDTFDRGGNVVIPSFAVGRTQELLYFLRKIKADGMVKGHDGFTVYIDSPLAIEATEIFTKNADSCYDQEAKSFVDQGINPLAFPGLKVAVTTQDSMAINEDTSQKVIISASGMCEAGRIRHHLKHNLWKRTNTVLFVGFQANNTLGRALINGAKTVKLFGEEISVNAQILQLPGISGHADSKGLINWINHFSPKPQRVFVNHGESDVCRFFADELKDKYSFVTIAPFSGTKVDLATNAVLLETQPVEIGKKVASSAARNAYERLVAAAQRLLSIAKKSDGHANKALGQFADQINALSDKWE